MSEFVLIESTRKAKIPLARSLLESKSQALGSSRLFFGRRSPAWLVQGAAGWEGRAPAPAPAAREALVKATLLLSAIFCSAASANSVVACQKEVLAALFLEERDGCY